MSTPSHVAPKPTEVSTDEPAALHEDPALRYVEPEALLRARDLDEGQKLALLRQWAEDVRLQAVAVAEGMGESEPALLRRIHAAIDLLSTGKAPRTSAPAGRTD